MANEQPWISDELRRLARLVHAAETAEPIDEQGLALLETLEVDQGDADFDAPFAILDCQHRVDLSETLVTFWHPERKERTCLACAKRLVEQGTAQVELERLQEIGARDEIDLPDRPFSQELDNLRELAHAPDKDAAFDLLRKQLGRRNRQDDG